MTSSPKLRGGGNGQASHSKREYRQRGSRRMCADQAVLFEKPYEGDVPFRIADDELRPPT